MYHNLFKKLECCCDARGYQIHAFVMQKDVGVARLAIPQDEHFCAFEQKKTVDGCLDQAECTECPGTELISGRVSCSCGRVPEVRDGRPDFDTWTVDRRGARRLQVVETDFGTDPRWNLFVETHPHGVIYLHSLWLEALQKEFGQEALSLACVDENGRFHGILPMFYTCGLPFGVRRVGIHLAGRRLASLPRTPIAGPLGSSRVANELLLREAVRRVKCMPGTTLQIKVDSNDLDGIIDGMNGTLWRDSFILELPGESGAIIRFGNAKEQHKVTWAVNRALRSGIKVREAENEEDLAAWYRLYLETMRRVVVPARPYCFFQELWRKMRPRSFIRLLLAEMARGNRSELLAGSIFLVFGQTVHYAFTGCNAPALALHANDLLQWEAIHHACTNAFRYYDFGEVGAEGLGLARFKGKWSSKAIPLYRYYYPVMNPPSGRSVHDPSDSFLVREIWQHLPLGLTEMIGRQIYRRL